MVPSGAGSVSQRVCPWLLRQAFNAAGYEARVARGELVTDVIYSTPPAPWSNEPPGTLSQRLRYKRLDGTVLAIAHQYLRPDGTIGGHGRPDPIILFTPIGRRSPCHDD